MQINNTQLNKILKIQQTKIREVANKTDKPSAEVDQLSLSQTASEIQGIKQFISELPPVRQDRIAAARKKLEQNNREVTGENIASAMISSLTGE